MVQDPDAVTATVRDRLTGATHEIRAKYVIGADGGRSTVAERGGFQIDGESKLRIRHQRLHRGRSHTPRGPPARNALLDELPWP